MNKYKYFLPLTLTTLMLTLTLLVGWGCKSSHFDSQPPASELNLVKDSYYYFMLAEADLDDEGSFDNYAFYVCHIYKERPPSTPSLSKYCVNAFATKDGEPVLVPKAIVELTKAGGILQKVGMQADRLGGWTRSTIVAGTAALLVIPVALSTLMGGISIGGLLSGEGAWAVIGTAQFLATTVGGGYGTYMFHKHLMNFPPESHLNDSISGDIDIAKLRAAGLTSSIEGKVNYKKMQQFVREHNIKNPNSRYQFVIAGQTRKDAGQMFAGLDLDDKQTTRFVYSKIPDMLPIIAHMMKEAKWVSENVTWHCLPKRDVDADNPRMCQLITKNWDTGNNPFQYEKPKELDHKSHDADKNKDLSF